MPAVANLVHETSTTTGTGALTLVNVNGKNSFNNAFGTGGTDLFDYFISNQSAAEWERGTGHLSDASTLVRDTVIESTNSDAAVDFSAGTKDVVNDVPALNQFLALPSVNALIITNNSATPTTSIDIDADSAILVNTSGDGIKSDAVNLTVACAGTGANGLDTGSLANNTWYNIFIISNGTTTAGLASTSATSPTMPSGYTYKYRVGAIRTGGSATFVRIRQVGNRAQYVVVSGSTTPNMPQMISGSSGSISTPTWTTVSVSDYVPPTAAVLLGSIHTNSSTTEAIVAPNDAYGAYNSSTNPPMVGTQDGGNTLPFDMVLESTNVYYASDGSSGALYARGWVDSVNAN